MDIFIFIKSINKIAIVAFAITFFFICYEIYLLIKEKKTKRKPIIPEFKVDQKYGRVKIATLVTKKEEKEFYQKSNPRLIIFLIILMFLFGGVFLLGIVVKEENVNPNLSNVSPAPLVKIVSSPGIKIYNEKWEEVPDEKLTFLKDGDKIFIGIKNIFGVDTDKARIRINADKWVEKNETGDLNQKFNLFYKEYQIATNETKLKIEAQLHSRKEGWLGE